MELKNKHQSKREWKATAFEWSEPPSIDQFPDWVCLRVDRSGALGRYGTTAVEHLALQVKLLQDSCE